MTDKERRVAPRHALWIPVQMKSESKNLEMLAVSRDISWSGMLMISAARLEIGDEVAVTVSIPGAEERQLTGKIVRVDLNEEDPEGLWRHRLAVAFDEEIPELNDAFETLAAKTE